MKGFWGYAECVNRGKSYCQYDPEKDSCGKCDAHPEWWRRQMKLHPKYAEKALEEISFVLGYDAEKEADYSSKTRNQVIMSVGLSVLIFLVRTIFKLFLLLFGLVLVLLLVTVLK